MTTTVTYTPAAYWHRQWDEITEPRQTVTVTRQAPRPDGRGRPRKQQPEPRLDWRGVPFPKATTRAPGLAGGCGEGR